MSIDSFLSATYDRRHYNCLHFANDVWQHEVGESLEDRLGSMLEATSKVDRHLSLSIAKQFNSIDNPTRKDICLALMRRRGVDPHVGVLVRGRIIHLRETGAQWVDPYLASLGYTEVKYYQ